MKDDFFDYLVIPFFCFGRRQWVKLVLNHPRRTNFLTMSIVLLGILFYMLCFLWLFYPYQQIAVCFQDKHAAYATPVCTAMRLCELDAPEP